MTTEIIRQEAQGKDWDKKLKKAMDELEQKGYQPIAVIPVVDEIFNPLGQSEGVFTNEIAVFMHTPSVLKDESEKSVSSDVIAEPHTPISS